MLYAGNELLTIGNNSNVIFQTTGSKWIGEVPTNWKISRIVKHFSIKNRMAGKEGYDVLSITQQGLKVKDVSTNEGQKATNYSGYTSCISWRFCHESHGFTDRLYWYFESFRCDKP